MDIKDLKKAWNRYSSIEKRELDEEEIREVLRGRTRSMIEKIERNIRIGFVIIFILILFFLVDDFLITPVLVDEISEGIKVPEWVFVLDVFTNLLIVFTFIFFVIRYYKVKRECDISGALSPALKKIIHTLNIYRQMFYLAIMVLVVSTATGFIAGMYQGVIYNARTHGISLQEMSTGSLILTLLLGLAGLLILTGGLYLLFRWGFRRLYGNYLIQLKETLQELNEIE
jgi:hypothetical protein